LGTPYGVPVVSTLLSYTLWSRIRRHFGGTSGPYAGGYGFGIVTLTLANKDRVGGTMFVGLYQTCTPFAWYELRSCQRLASAIPSL
jgi:hypothetical protein